MLLVPPAQEVLEEIKRTMHYLHCVLPPIFRLELSHSVIENKVYYGLDTTLHYFSNEEKKRIDRPEVIGVAKGEGGHVAHPSN